MPSEAGGTTVNAWLELNIATARTSMPKASGSVGVVVTLSSVPGMKNSVERVLATALRSGSASVEMAKSAALSHAISHPPSSTYRRRFAAPVTPTPPTNSAGIVPGRLPLRIRASASSANRMMSNVDRSPVCMSALRRVV